MHLNPKTDFLIVLSLSLQDDYLQGTSKPFLTLDISPYWLDGDADPAFILQDVLTGDEIVSDSFDVKEIDGVAYEVDCAMIEEGAVSIGS